MSLTRQAWYPLRANARTAACRICRRRSSWTFEPSVTAAECRRVVGLRARARRWRGAPPRSTRRRGLSRGQLLPRTSLGEEPERGWEATKVGQLLLDLRIAVLAVEQQTAHADRVGAFNVVVDRVADHD